MDNKDLAVVNPAASYLGLSFGDIKNVATALAGAGIFQDAKDVNVAFAKILAGQEMGLTPFQAMQEISFINGKPSLSANAKAAKIKQTGKYNYRVIRLDSTGCELEFFENGKSVGKVLYDEAMAKLQGVYDRNPNYKKVPDDMYFAGALRKGQRRFAPDATGGINTYDREEVEVIEVMDTPKIEPKAKAEPKPEPAPEPEPTPEPTDTPHTPTQRKRAMALLNEMGFVKDEDKKAIYTGLTELSSFKDLTQAQADDLIAKLEQSDPEALRAMFLTKQEEPF